MNYIDHEAARLARLHSFEHPRYFYGQLLGVSHFEAEQDYFKGRLSTFHRLVTGYGVACGLDVCPDTDNPGNVFVTSGYAIDRWGREIVVPCRSKPVTIEPWVQPPSTDQPGANTAAHTDEHHENNRMVHLVLCYRECKTGAEPSMSGDCGSSQSTYGTIREGYELIVCPGRAKKMHPDPEFQESFCNGPINHAEIACWVTRQCQPCLDPHADPCIVLANIHRPDKDKPVDKIDITVRPIVYTPHLLFELLLALGLDSKRGGRNYGGQPYDQKS